jgi:hypothetical protein
MDRLVVAAVLASVYAAFFVGTCALYLLYDWLTDTHTCRRNHT